MKNTSYLIKAAIIIAIVISVAGCTKKVANSGTPPPPPPPPPPALTNDVSFWLTRPDQTALLAQQNVTIGFTTTANSFPVITVDTTQTFQTMDGFGYTLTGGSAQLMNALPPVQKTALLNELFSPNGIAISYLRLSIGASDLSSAPFTYNDLPAGQTDVNLTHFSLDPERINLIPLLKDILAINPAIKLLATPWSPPVWMKTNNSFIGGKLKPEYYGVYANYFVKYIQAMKAEGITIDAITPQNEPLHDGNNPSLKMEAAEQADFIKNHLGPAFRTANLSTKIIIYDHNADRPDYPLAILNDPAAKAFVHGSAFHLYGGNISALSTVYNAHPDRHIYFTEQYTASDGNFGGDLGWHLKNLVVGAPRNWSKTVLEWNLANDPNYGPHTPGGCTTCKGAITISGTSYTRNVAYYIIAHASKFVPAGSVRVASNITGNLHNVAYVTPQGKKVLIVFNETNAAQSFNIKFKEKWAMASLDANAAGTFVW